MPGTTRYSATFDRTYEEEEDGRPAEAPVSRRSRSQSWQCQTSTESRRYRPLDGLRQARSPSTDKGQTAVKGAEVIPTRNVGKASVKAHNNPFQFVKVNTAPLHHKAEEQLKKLQEIKKPPVVKEDEEEWQMNLDSWKSRRRKMSETAIRRQEELRQFETEDQSTIQNPQKKTKTFSEMVEQRAHRGRALSLCLFSNPLESSDWIFEANKSRANRMRSQDPLSGESAESSTMNSEDDNESYMKHEDDDDKNNYNYVNNNSKSPLTNGHHNSIENSASNSSISKSSELSEYEASQGSLTGKDRNCNGGYIDSGLESLSSSHRTGDIPDSGSDFSHDSGSSLDCDSPRVSALITTGIELLEEFSSKDEDLFSMNTNCQKQVPMKEPVASPINNVQPPLSKMSSSEVSKVKTKKVVKKETGSKKANVKSSQSKSEEKNSVLKVSSSTTKSEESENEMFVDDFEELARLKNAKGAAEKPNADIKVNGISSPDTSFVDPVNHSLNVIYKSSTEDTFATSLQDAKVRNNSSSKVNPKPFSLITEVPVEKITEEMERLILEQLEEEEKAKENASADGKGGFEDNKNDLAPIKHVEPPKEKPPPPPSSSPPSAASKESPLKRVNSTKRIIKEIHKRRSDFLGIDKTVEDSMHSEASVPPPPVLEDLLRAEREQDRLRRQMLASKIPSQSPSEEDEIAKKEQEIIENLETEERLRQKQEVSAISVDIQAMEEERINKLKEEHKQIEEERLIAEEQKARLEEARLLQKREEYIRKQEVDNNKGSTLSSLSSSIDAPSTNPVTVLPIVEGGCSLLSQNGDGQNNKAIPSSPSVTDVPKTKDSPPATLPKPPPKKKEAIRKERERLRQEQEALQREREEHRLNIQKEQEQLKKNAQNSHVSPRVDPPIPAKPTQQSRLTNSSLISPVQLQQGDSYNGSSLGGRDTNGNQTMGGQSATSRQPRSAVARTKARVQQKVPCVRKQAEPTTDGRYNQNHWLIQEAEMRRIAEQKERQRNSGSVDTRFIAANQVTYHQPPVFAEEYRQTVPQRPSNLPIAQTPSVNSSNYAVPAQLYSPDQHWTFPSQSGVPPRNTNPSSAQTVGMDITTYSRPSDHSVSGPVKPVKGAPLEKQEQMLSVSGRKRCSHCGEELGRGAAMIIESLQLYYHIQCFQCCVCQAQLGNGSCGTDVRVRNNKLHCHNCYSNDEAGLKFSQV